MPVPPNQTAATAISIGTLTGYTPYTTTQDAWDGAQTVQDLWYSYTPVTGDKGLEVYGYGNGTTYIPHTTIWSGPASAPVQLANSHDSQSRPIQQDIQTFRGAGESIFFRFRKQSGNNNPSILTIRIARWQDEPIQPLELFINDSSEGYPGIVMSAAAAIPTRYELNYPAGEGQQILQNGIVAVIDAFGTVSTGPVLYDVSTTGFTVRVIPTMPDTHYTKGLSSNQIDTFVSTKRFGGNAFFVTIDTAGVVGTPVDTGSTGFIDLVPQRDLTAVYGMDGTDLVKITNPGGVSSVLVAAAGLSGLNLLMLTDDTIIGWKGGAGTLNVDQYDLSGTLLQNIPLTSVAGGVANLERIFADPGDPEFFWIWWQTAVTNHFDQYSTVTGAVTSRQLSRTKFIESVSQVASIAAPDTVYSGADFSCVPIILRGGSATTTTNTIRRERRFLLPSSPDNKRMQIPTLELLMRTGIGLLPGDAADPPVLGSDPIVMMRISKDGGQTWLPERQAHAGPQGQYDNRVYWLRATGMYRNAVCEIAVSDPVFWQFLAMMGTPTEGSS